MMDRDQIIAHNEEVRLRNHLKQDRHNQENRKQRRQTEDKVRQVLRTGRYEDLIEDFEDEE